MPGRIVVVATGEAGDREFHCEPSWQRLTWKAFLARAHASGRDDLVILLALGDRLRNLDVFRALPDCAKGRLLAILPREASPEEIDLAFRAADDVILWPERDDAVRRRIQRLLVPATAEFDEAYENLAAELIQVNLVGRDPSFLNIAERLSTSARADFPVLITGETGTGKEVFARAVHFLSRRRNQAFVPVDCAAIPDHLFENELFGHVRGAYTDARGDQRGLASMAEGGTLFLDEIDALSLPAQAKLLRFLQERQYKALGADRYTHSDVKLVAATNGRLEEQVAEKRFRQDLYFRLHVLRLDLPPLRERPGDIVLLAEHFLALYAQPGERRSFTPAALEQLRAYSWPGNVRELLHAVQHAIVFCRTAAIPACEVLPPVPACRAAGFRQAREQAVQDFERGYVEEMLRRHTGNVTHAAREAGKERRAFGRLVKKYGLSAGRGAGQS
jgi:DNA-binding NtrC family response regulator